MPFRVLAFLCFLALASCLDNKDYTLDSLTLTPTVALPLATGTISVMDLVSSSDSSYLKVYPDGLLYFSYPTTFPSSGVHDLFLLPDKNFPLSFNLPTGTLPSSAANTTLGTITPLLDLNLAPQRLTEILLKAGSLGYTISLSQATNPTLPLEVKVTMTQIVDKTSLVPLTFTTGVGTGTRLLKDYIIKMNANKFDIKLDIVAKGPRSTVFIPANTKVNIQFSFTGMDFRYLKGFLGDITANLPQQTIPITVFSSSLNKSKISLVQPLVTLSVDNYYGVPSEVTFSKLQAEKTGVVLPLQISPTSPFSLNIPSVLGNSATTSLSVTNAAAIINFSPTQLVYAASVRINKGLSSGNNFLTDSTLRVTLNTEVPLYGQASGISLIDTMKMDFGDLTNSSVFSSSLKLKTVNEMPLDANIQLYLADKNKIIIDSVFTSNQTYLVKASSVTSGGDLQKATAADLQIDLSTDKVNKLFSSSYLIIKAKMNTTKDSNGTLLNVKFKSAYKLKMNVGLIAKLSIKTK